MFYMSTRDDKKRVSGAEAIASGLSEDGGLFVPEAFPKITPETIEKLISEPYSRRAAYIMGLFLDEFSASELNAYADGAYSTSKINGFNHSDIAPLKRINKSTHFLELWHGPTCAFKDMALQVMPKLLTASLKKIGEKRDVCILVATSGDTGKAALEGFSEVPGTKIMVFYPRDGVSEVQKLQMVSQTGANVNVLAVDGNFDDAQTGVKAIFSDKSMIEDLDRSGYILSSANSINWGRLVPQLAYYISAYCDLVSSNEVVIGDKINFCVPTGNFGNILAAYYSEKMGLPVNKLICASNRNDVLTQFINTGIYDKNRPFYTTVSPSMDILVSSNLERLLFELSGKNGYEVTSYMNALSKEGRYTVPDTICDELNRIFHSGYCSEEDTMKTIKQTYNNSDYLIDTHTAVAYKVLDDYRESTGDDKSTVVVSTASPFKFCEAVLEALGYQDSYEVESSMSGVMLIDMLSKATGCAIPKPLIDLKLALPRFTGSTEINEMKTTVIDFIRGH